MIKSSWSTITVITLAMFGFLFGYWRGENHGKRMQKIECSKQKPNTEIKGWKEG